MSIERRISNRSKFGYYMPVFDNRTHESIGYLSDISTQGFKLESQKSVLLNSVYHMRLDLTPEFSKKSFIVFYAKAVWSNPDPVNPQEYVHGFQIVSISPDEQFIFERIVEKYGEPKSKW